MTEETIREVAEAIYLCQAHQFIGKKDLPQPVVFCELPVTIRLELMSLARHAYAIIKRREIDPVYGMYKKKAKHVDRLLKEKRVVAWKRRKNW